MTELILKGPPDTNKLPQESLGIIYYNELHKKDPKNTVIVDWTNEEITYEKLLHLSIGLAKKFQKLGLKKNDVITIISENHWRYMATVLAAFFIGATVNLINCDYSTGELKHLLSVCQPKLIFCTTKSLNNLEPLQNETFFADIVISYDSVVTSWIINFEDFLLEENNDKIFIPVKVNPQEDVALILISSGTTGLPKCVQLTHSNFRALLVCGGDSNILDINQTDILIGFLPFFHIFGLGISFLGIFYGAKIVILKKFHPECFLSIIQQHKVTKLFVVPPILLFLVKSPLVKNYDLTSIKAIIYGAAPASKELAEIIKKELKIENVRELYGMTELCGLVTITPQYEEGNGSCGKLIPACWAKVCDIITGKPLPPYEKGELRFKGPNVMKCYLGREIETKDAFDEEGYLKSGDIGYYDKEGNIYIVDRLKEIIKYKGFQVSPAELENILIQHPAVKDVGVVGKPDTRAGEVPVAFIVKELKKDVTEDELIKYVSENLSVQKHLYGGVKFVNEIPKNAGGKILRRKLKELL